MRVHKTWLILCVFSAHLSLLAQENNNSSPVFQEGNLSQFPKEVPTRSTIDGTLNQAARKIKSNKLQERVGAAKLLGKYPGTQAGLLLIGALDDTSELVRRAALVSLVEHFNNGSPVYEQALAEKIFSKLADPDVEVRREVSALIPRLVPGLMRSGMERIQVNGRTVFRSIPGRLRGDLQRVVENGLLDPDSIVRQNILKHHYSLRIQINPQTFGQLLEDKDSSVLLIALDQLRMYATRTGIFPIVESLTSHPDIGVRSKLAKVAMSIGRSFPQYRKVLRKMTTDDEDEIATLAAVDLARLGEGVSPEMIERIIQYLSQSRGLYGKAENLFYSLSALGRDAAEIYQSLLNHSSASMRAKAWERYLSMQEGWNSPSLWITALKDRDVQVRETVLSLVRGRVEKIEEDELSLLVRHNHGDVRALAAELLLVADEELVEEYYFNLLIDDQSLVRSTTLRALANLRFKDWIILHSRSLTDDDYNIQRAAMDGLLSDRTHGVPRLIEYLHKYPAEKISSLAKKELQRMGINP